MTRSIIRKHTSAGNSTPPLEVNRLVAMRLLGMRSKNRSEIEFEDWRNDSVVETRNERRGSCGSCTNDGDSGDLWHKNPGKTGLSIVQENKTPSLLY